MENKKFFSLVFSLIYIITMIPMNVFTLQVKAYSTFAGSGTKDNPYQISSAKDLFLLSELINDEETNPDYRFCHYIQTNDIDLDNEFFTPIGVFYGNNGELTSNAIFAGSYDGDYHTITGLNIDCDAYYCGLFGRIGQASYDNSNCIIKNLSVEGNINSTKDFVGSIIGEIGYGASIENCNFHGIVNGNQYVGGIVGTVQCGGNILNSYCNAEIVANDTESIVGGIVGLIKVGNNTAVGSSDLILQNCYVTGSVDGKNSGGICGKTIIYEERENSTIIFNNNYYLNTACDGGVNGENVSGCTKLVSVALKACADMLGSPFVDNTDETINDGYPIFEWQSKPYQFKGEGTKDNPYQVSSKEELEKMRNLVNSTYFNPIYGHAYYVQTADIDLKNEDWIPIGLGYDDAEDGTVGQGTYNYQTRMFYGDYNGNGKNIINLSINGNWKDIGLFGYVRGGCVHNLVVFGDISMPNNSGDWVGGIVGQMQYNAILNQCAFIGNISGGYNAGGVVGYIWAGGNVLNCYHNGEVSSNGISGGVVGQIRFGEYNLDGDSSIVENCYHVNGNVTGTTYSGGVVGDCVFYEGISNTITINNCYFSSGTAQNVTSANATLDNTLSLPGSLLKKIADDLGSSYIDNTDSSLNNGYPVFIWQINKEGIKGDINFDNQIDYLDILILKKHIFGINVLTEEEFTQADLNSDNIINILDLVILKSNIL